MVVSFREGLLLWAFLSVAFSLPQTPSMHREERGTFYLANTARSTNCLSKDGREGYCLFQGCFVNDMMYQGRCGYGLGSCCLAEQSCKKSTNVLTTYFVNPNYPLTTTSLGSCGLTIKRRSADICQIRLDFVDFELEQPDNDGYCYNDALSITGGKISLPRICGSNKGQHLYIAVDQADYESPVMLSIDIKDLTLLPRTWNIKVSQIECAAEERAPPGCLQYFNGAHGTVKSFNFATETEANRQISNTEYSICVKQETGYCSIAWSLNEVDGQFAFTLTGDVSKAEEEKLGSPTLLSSECKEDYILIPNGVDDEGNSSDRLCGLGFANRITTSLTPFLIHARTGPSEEGDVLNRGFSLKYSQVKCK